MRVCGALFREGNVKIGSLSLGAYEKKLAGFEIEIRSREIELERRSAAAQLELAKADMAQVAARVEA